jgi:hypothetical protein
MFPVTGKTGRRQLRILSPYYIDYLKKWIELHPKGNPSDVVVWVWWIHLLVMKMVEKTYHYPCLRAVKEWILH